MTFRDDHSVSDSDARLMASQLPDIVGLRIEEFRPLMEVGLFPCPDGCNGWDEGEARDWAQALRESAELADNVEFVLGYRPRVARKLE